MKNFLILLLVVLVIVAAIFWIKRGRDLQKIKSISSFEECEAAGFPIMESFPRRCLTPDGKSFTEEVISDFNTDPQTGTFEMMPASQIVWEGKRTFIEGYVDRGTISLKSSNVTVENNEIKSGELVFDMSSIAVLETGKGSGNDSLVKHLKSGDFFDVEKYPTAIFKVVSSKKSESADADFVVTGDLTIKGNTKRIEVPFSVYVASPELVFVGGEVVLDRTEFNVRYGSGKFFGDIVDKAIDDKFKLIFDLKALKKP